MKKLLLGITFLLMLTLLVACGGSDSEPRDINGDSSDETNEEDITDEVTFGGEDFLLWIGDEDFAEALIPALEAKFPDTNFSWHEMGNVDSLTNLSLDGPAGLGADIIFFPHDHIHRAVSENLVFPVGPQITDAMQGRFHDAAVSSVYHDGLHFGVPLTTESVAMFYNKTLLDELGFEPATTFEELFEQAKEFNDPANNQYLFRWEPGNAFQSHFALTAHGFELFGEDHMDPDLVNFNTPEVIAGLEWLKTVREEILPVPVADLDTDNTAGAFIDGEVGYLITGPWDIAEIIRDGDFEFGVMKLPTINGNQPITFSGNIVAAGSGFTDYPDLTRAVLEFLMFEGLQIMYDVRGWIPALIDGSSIEGLADNPYHVGILGQAYYSHPMPIIPEMTHFWAVSGGMYSAVWDDILSPVEAAEHAALGYDSARALAEQ